MSIDTSRLSLRPFTEEALPLTHEWLNDPEIQELTKTAPFTREQQLVWFNTLESRDDFIVKSLYLDEEMIGAWGIKNINRIEGHAEPYCYIGKKEYWGLGIGDWLMNKNNEACIEIGMKKIVGIMLVRNFRIVNLHFKQGFRIKKYEDGYYHMEKYL